MIALKPLPPAEAIKFFRQKGFAVGFDWRDVWQTDHQAAFTVAKAMQLSVLKSIRAQVDRALADGVPFRNFAQTLQPELVRKGWWGRALMEDPKTRELREVQLGSVRRLQVIYDTNLRTSHSEGQWERIQKAKDDFGLLIYDANNSEAPRAEHAAWDGLVLPVDDPFWQEHMPIKAWGCKCRVRQLSDAQAKRRGLTVGPRPDVPATTYRNKRTGQVQRIPRGVDPEFNYPPGGRRQSLDDHLVFRLADAAPEDAAAAIRSGVAAPEFEQWLKMPKGNMPVMHLPQEVATALGAHSRIGVMSAESAGKQAEVHPELTLEEYRVLPLLGESATVVVQDGKQSAVAIRREGRRIYSAAIKVTQSGLASFVTSFRRTNREDVAKWLRRGQVILGEWK
ncbi:MAG: phage minor head protein [Nitrospirota bacterium]|nr:phage minor head protein [Nitrospirota bacterium]